MFAVTKRLLLRPGWKEDAPALAAAIADERIVRNLATAPWPYRLEDAEAFLAQPGDPRYPTFLVFDRTADPVRLVGSVGFRRCAGGEPELGYWIASDRWGEGLAAEAAEAALAAARASFGHRRIIGGHFADNPASGRVLAKLGFRPTGRIMRRFCLARGREVDGPEFVLDFDAQADAAMARDEEAPRLEEALAA